MCYHTGMCTTHNNEETPRPEPCCPRCGNSEDAPNSHDLCENCLEAWEVLEEGDLPTGYEADDERPYGWDVPEEEYPDW